MFTKIIMPLAAAGMLALGGCASNYAGEGALAGAAGGAIIGAATNGNVGRGALIGGAAGAAVGSIIRKDGKCYRYDSNGDRYRVRC